MDLQMFGLTPVQGKKMIYLMRVLGDAATEAAAVVPYTTEDTLTISADGDTTATKDGPITTPGTPEIEFSKTAIMAYDSSVTGDTIVDKLRQAVVDGSIVELWEANLARPASTSGKYKGMYYQGLLTEFEVTANAEDLCEVSFSYRANGTGAEGDVTVTAEQQEIASYTFVDTPKTGV